MSAKSLNVVSACDEGYALGLCVMVRSVLENLPEDVELRLFVLDGGIRCATRERMLASWREFDPSVEWISPDPGEWLDRVQRRGHAGVDATYFRLFLGELLPVDVSTVVYLDADVIVTTDLTRLFDTSFEGRPVLAVPDRYAVTLHLSRVMRATFPYRERFHEAPDYFNAGVLGIDLQAWRRERIGEQALTIARDHGEQLVFHDQDALNCVLAGRWTPLDVTWNFHELAQSLRSWETRGASPSRLRRLWHRPGVVHFTSSDKPWDAVCLSPFRGVFDDIRGRTGFATQEDPEDAPGLLDREIARSVELNWLLWRGVVHTRDASLLRRAARLLLRRPWMLLTYPLWAATSWLREHAVRLREKPS